MATKIAFEKQITLIDDEIHSINEQISKLKQRLKILKDKRESVHDSMLAEQSEQKLSTNWSRSDFVWSIDCLETRNSVFKLLDWRPLQLEVINATMSDQDAIVIMPTGGGKSLCYQLPALLSKGVTLVVSPLISLMEDQIMALKKLGIPAMLLSSTSTKEDTKTVREALIDSSSQVKIVYVTPERLAKSKSFMNQLQRCYANGRFSRLAVDEVHCCSTWGHDFRTDYNYLSVFKGLFPQTPILGLTATSTTKVTLDVQKMLSIEGCLVLRAPFNRPNLRYSVIQKPDKLAEAAEIISDWLQTRFKGESGIIYTTSIRECEDLLNALEGRSIKAGIYHAMLSPQKRSRTHENWMENRIQVVIATVAFGMGIDKPDVRFVIHHSIPKSMETFYQESGRAGRDGKTSDCILMYRLQDTFKISPMVFTQRTGLENLYGVLKYCLEAERCRRSIISRYFNENWDSSQCKEMCDNCSSKRDYKTIDALNYCKSIYKLLDHASGREKHLTILKLMDAWMQKGDRQLRVSALDVPKMNKNEMEMIIAILLIEGYLKEDFQFTAFTSFSYLKKGPLHNFVEDSDNTIQIKMFRLSSNVQAQQKKSSKSKHTVMDIEEPVAHNTVNRRAESDDIEIVKELPKPSRIKTERNSLKNARTSDILNSEHTKNLDVVCLDSGEDEIGVIKKRPKVLIYE